MKTIKRIGNQSPKRRMGTRMLASVLAVWLFCASILPIRASSALSVETAAQTRTPPFSLDCKAAVLMEASTGKVLFEQNADEALPPASITKVMTLLLVMEAIERGELGYDTMIRASANACSMGGSQIFLEEGEEMSAEDLIKSVVIASANDAAVALAEQVAGSEEAFVTKMNERAASLGMSNTCFENTNGLDDTAQNHVCSARDIALMSCALLRYPKITEYSSIWMDSIRDGQFGLTNTNRLVRFYRGANGLKTGSTSKAGFCITASAEREGMTLIAVIMAAPTRDSRNASAATLLDWGFSNFALFREDAGSVEGLFVRGGEKERMTGEYNELCAVIPKSGRGKVQATFDCAKEWSAPIKKGDLLGSVIYTLDGEKVGSCEIVAKEDVDRIGFFGVLKKLFLALSVF